MKGFNITLDTAIDKCYSIELAEKINGRITQLKAGKKATLSFDDIRDDFVSKIECDKKLDLKSDGFIEQLLLDNGIEVIEC